MIAKKERRVNKYDSSFNCNITLGLGICVRQGIHAKGVPSEKEPGAGAELPEAFPGFFTYGKKIWMIAMERAR